MNTLNEALSDPQTMQQVNSLLASLSAGGNDKPPNAADMISDGGSTPPAVSGDMDRIVKLMGILQQNGRDDGSIGLIMALKPLLKPETRPKADRVIKLMRLMNAYPLLRDSGMLDDLF